MKTNILSCSRTSSAIQKLLPALSLVLVLFAASVSFAQPNVYVVTFNQQFGVVNLATGSFHQIGPNTPEPQANLVWGPDGSLLSITVSGNLVKINPATGETTVIGQTGLFFNAFDLAEVGGKLYATDLSNNLYLVDPKSGAATLLAATGMPSDPAIPFTQNADGTINLCDESLYAFAGKLYATFDAFTLDPNTLSVKPVVAPMLYQIDPRSGVATAIGTTIMNLGASVEVNGKFYGFRWTTTAFTEFGPQNQSQLVEVDLGNGNTRPLLNLDPAASGITGAAPMRFGR